MKKTLLMGFCACLSSILNAQTENSVVEKKENHQLALSASYFQANRNEKPGLHVVMAHFIFVDNEGIVKASTGPGFTSEKLGFGTLIGFQNQHDAMFLPGVWASTKPNDRITVFFLADYAKSLWMKGDAWMCLSNPKKELKVGVGVLLETPHIGPALVLKYKDVSIMSAWGKAYIEDEQNAFLFSLEFEPE